MALVYPIDILSSFPGWVTDFSIGWRREYSRQAGGRTRMKDLGPPLWRMTAVSREVSPNELDAWRARLDGLEEGFRQFRGYKLSRTYPIAYPKGAWPTGSEFTGETVAVNTIGAQNRSLRLKQLPIGFQLRVGDMISITRGTNLRDLHEVMEASTAASTGITPEFEIRPHLWVGAAVNQAVSVVRPWCPMRIVPGSIQATTSLQGRGTITFQGEEDRG